MGACSLVAAGEFREPCQAAEPNPTLSPEGEGLIKRGTMTAYLAPIGLLIISNIFMTFAWYGHLGDMSRPLWLAVLVAWGIAFFEYCLAVPANRIGYGVYTAAELKTLQEVITLIIFAGFAVFWLGEKLTLNHLVGFGLIAAGAFFIFKGPIAV